MTTDSSIPPALLVFSLGPVQDFIATARRTQDLWMGSYILSYLAQAALREVVGDVRDSKSRARIVYPDLSGEGEDQHPILQALWFGEESVPGLTLATLPNKFVASVVDEEEGARLGQAAEAAVFRTWRELAADVSERFPGPLAATQWRRLTWDANPELWFEVYWCVQTSVPGEAYSKLNRRAESALQARKRLRNFLPAESAGEKCTICGLRSALAPAPGMPRPDLRKAWGELALDLSGKSEARDPQYRGLTAALTGDGAERLCAVCSVKRFAQRFHLEDKIKLHGAFPSTSSVATVVFRQQVLAREQALRQTSDESDSLARADRLREAREGLIRALQTAKVPPTLAAGAFPCLNDGVTAWEDWLRYDGDLFYADTYTPKRFEADYGVKLSEKQLRELQSRVGALRSAARAVGIDLLPKYYAILVMDGDGMGDKLGKAQSTEDHRQLSRAVRQFALKHVRGIVEAGLGRVVYAGGDDLLAFLPLEQALAVARDLHDAFEQCETGVTLRAGLAIAHHQAPLDGALRAARRAEKAAKEIYGRNAIVVTVLKRSGEQLDVGARWSYDGLEALQNREASGLGQARRTGTLVLVERLRDAFRSDALSSKLAYDAEREARPLRGIPNDDYAKMLKRLVGRHAGRTLDEKASADFAAQLAALRLGLQTHLPREAEPDGMPATLEIARWLLLARFLAGAGED